jgi:hypothetical protein
MPVRKHPCQWGDDGDVDKQCENIVNLANITILIAYKKGLEFSCDMVRDKVNPDFLTAKAQMHQSTTWSSWDGKFLAQYSSVLRFGAAWNGSKPMSDSPKPGTTIAQINTKETQGSVAGSRICYCKLGGQAIKEKASGCRPKDAGNGISATVQQKIELVA